MIIHRIILNFFLAFILSGSFSPPRAALLGSFEHIHNLPGYLELSQRDSYIYDAQKVLGINDRKISDGIDYRSPSRILREDYLNRDGSIKLSSIEEDINGVHKLMENAFLFYCSSKGDSDCRLQYGNRGSLRYEKWLKKKFVAGASFALDEFNRSLELALVLGSLDAQSLRSQEARDFLEALFQGLETYAALRSEEDEDWRRKNTKIFLKTGLNILNNVEIVDRGREAVNLKKAVVTTSTPLIFYHPQSFKEEGDISFYDPIDSGFWRRPQYPISQFDTTNYNNQLRVNLGEEEYSRVKDIERPATPISLEYVKVLGGGKTSKIKVRWNGKKDIELKLKLHKFSGFNRGDKNISQPFFLYDFFKSLGKTSGSEVRSEFVANNLASALGFTVFPTYFKREVHLFLPNDNFSASSNSESNSKNFLRAKEKLVDGLLARPLVSLGNDYRVKRLEFLNQFKNHGVVKEGAQRGRYYIKVKTVSLEFRSNLDRDFSVGAFNKHTYGKYLKREFRAFMIFHMWVSDFDIKNANFDLGITSENKVYYSASDMGSSFGNIFSKNRPNYLGYDLVDGGLSKRSGNQVLSLKGMYPVQSPLFKAITFADIKWITRMMAQLTKQQIKHAFLAVDYPEVVAELFTQKLLRRRDQLVQIFGLHGEVVKTHGDRAEQVVLSGKTSNIVDPKTYFTPNCQNCFKEGELISLPVGVEVDENWIASYKNFATINLEKISIQGAIKTFLKIFGAHAISRKLQRYHISQGINFHGVKVGPSTFMPARYLVKNPDTSANGKGNWIVDVFRIGVRAGSYDESLKEYDFILNKNSLKSAVEAEETFEFIKITSVSEYDEYNIDNLLKVYKPKNIGLPLAKLKSSMIDNLKKGDLLISSRYITLGGNIKSGPLFYTYGIGLSGKSFTSAIDRVALYKETESDIDAVWMDVSNVSVKARLYFDYILGNLPLLAKRHSAIRENRKVYRFNLDKKEERSTLLENINKNRPRISKNYEIKSAYVRRVAKNFLISLFGFLERHTNREESHIKLSDREERLLKDLVLVQKGKVNLSRHPISWRKVKGSESAAIVDRKDGTLLAKLDVTYLADDAKRSHYIKLIDEYKGIIPEKMIQFDADSVNYYMGQLSIDARVLFSNSALRELLNHKLDKLQACAIYSQYARLRWLENKDFIKKDEINHFCHRIFIDRISYDDLHFPNWRDEAKGRAILFGALSFVEKLRKAQKSYHLFNKSMKKDGLASLEASKKLLNAISNLLKNDAAKGPTHMALLALMDKDKLYREVRVESSYESFPGQEFGLDLHKKWRGDKDLKDLPLWDLKDPVELLEMSIQPALSALQPIFYDDYWLAGAISLFSDDKIRRGLADLEKKK